MKILLTSLPYFDNSFHVHKEMYSGIGYRILRSGNLNAQKKKIINMLTRHAIWGNKRHVEYYSSKASLYNATKTLSKDYPKRTFCQSYA